MEPMPHTTSVVGVLDDMAAVEPLLQRLADLGITVDDVSLMTRDGKAIPANEPTAAASPVAGGAATGAAFGGLLGGLAGWMISIGAIAIPGVVVPGVGAVFGAGVLAATLTGIAVGAAAGGLVGALLGLGVPEDEARQYEDYLKHGRVLLTVHVPEGGDTTRVVDALEGSGAYDVRAYEVRAEEDEEEQAPLASAVDQGAEGLAAPQAGNQALDTVQSGSTGMPPAPLDSVGEVSAQTDSLGSGAAGGHGDGAATGPAPEPEDLGTRESEPARSIESPADVRTSEGTSGPGEAGRA